MPLFCTGVIAGSLLSLLLPRVPGMLALWVSIPLCLLAFVPKFRVIGGICCFLSCFIWHYQQHVTAAEQLLLQPARWLKGTIVDTPRQYDLYTRFTLKLNDGPAKGFYVTVSWATPPQLLQSGQQWQLYSRLKPVHGVANPGGVLREANAFVKKQIATASVAGKPDAVLLKDKTDLRQQLLNRLQQKTADFDTSALLMALTVNERQYDHQLWSGLQNSGLGHLLSISGLHISLVFGWGVLLATPLRFLGLSPITHQLVSLAVASALAYGYAWLAGFDIPTLRALLALFILVVGRLLLKPLALSDCWLLLCAVLLLVHPMLVLSRSFWLSVLAVAVILLVVWRYPLQRNHWHDKLGLFFRFHVYLTLLMSLLGLLLFGGIAPISIISNIVFVPLSSLLGIPLLLLSMIAELLSVPAGYLWWLTDWSFQPLLLWLYWCAEPVLWWALPRMSVTLVTISMLLTLILLFTRNRLTGLAAIVISIPLLAVNSQSDRWQMHLLDVGQGLAVVIQYGKRAMMYDAGPRYGSFSATENTVLPFLRTAGVEKLDYLILSHDDSDHTGNWSLLQAYYPDLKVVTDISGIDNAITCTDAPAMYLDVSLQLLHHDMAADNKNDQSCVFLLNIDGWFVLLPGDISQKVEQQLLAQYPQLRTDILLLSHHGSNTGSGLLFLQQMAPQLALNSAGFMNPYRHPAIAVQRRLSMLGIPLLNTAELGAITVTFHPGHFAVDYYRASVFPVWLRHGRGIAETSTTR